MSTLTLALIFALAVVVGSTLASPPPAPAPVIGQLPQFGNGFVATFVNRSSTFVAGVFDGAGTASTGAAFPTRTNVYLDCAYNGYVNEATRDAAQFTFPFGLDLDTATVFLNGTCGGVSFRQRWYAHRSNRNLLVTELFASSSSSKNQSVPIFDEPVTLSNYPNIKSLLVTKPPSSDIEVTVYSTITPEIPGDKSLIRMVAVARVRPPSSVTVTTAAGEKEPVMRVAMAYLSSLEFPHDDVYQLAARARQHLGAFMKGKSSAQAHSEHAAAWRDLWAHSYVTDSPSASPPIRSSQYALLCSLRNDWPWSTSPGGLPTSNYRDHRFWDGTFWDSQGLGLLYPDIVSGSIIPYRLDRLAGARINAQQTLGMPRGTAAFPWESAATGVDVCPAPMFAHTEIHVTADVVVGIRQYYRATGNVSMVRSAWSVLNETSQFWVHRTTAFQLEQSGAPADSPVDLNNVTSPDEYYQGNNSVYTNYAVRDAVAFTLEAMSLLGIDAGSVPNYAAMHRIVYYLTILYNKTSNMHPEFKNYNGSKSKQADVILINFPLGVSGLNSSTARNDLNYYAPRTKPNPSGASTMTWSMFSVGYFSVGEMNNGMEYFYKGYQLNTAPPYWAWYQALNFSGCDNFVTGAGGFLQSVWAGLGGLRVAKNSIVVLASRAALPEDASYLALRGLRFRGNTFTVLYNRSKCDGTKSSSSTTNKYSPACITVELHGKDTSSPQHDAQQLCVGRSSIGTTDSSPFSPAAFEDEVLSDSSNIVLRSEGGGSSNTFAFNVVDSSSSSSSTGMMKLLAIAPCSEFTSSDETKPWVVAVAVVAALIAACIVVAAIVWWKLRRGGGNIGGGSAQLQTQEKTGGAEYADAGAAAGYGSV